MTLTEEVIQVVLGAPEERKREALRVLKGEFPPEKVWETETYLTLRAVARRLGISACSLWRYGVPGHELGGRRRFRMSEVEEYLASAEFKSRAADLKEQRREERSQVAGWRGSLSPRGAV